MSSGSLNKRDLTIVATGSEVEIGYEASLNKRKELILIVPYLV